jgi:hypothetical protein
LDFRKEGNFFCSGGILQIHKAPVVYASILAHFSISNSGEAAMYGLEINQAPSVRFISRRAKSNTAGANTVLQETF